MKRTLCVALVATALVLTSIPSALAGPPRPPGPPIHHYCGHPHGGAGFWWAVAGITGLAIATSALSHPEPVVAAPVYYTTPPVVPQPQTVVAPPAQPSQTYWYYCDDSRSYYPHVTDCPSGWQTVPATPPDLTR